LEQDCREAHDQGYEFDFSWLLILITFITWEIPEGATFPEVKPLEPLFVKFIMLRYSSNIEKQWKSNAVFHTYYLQLKRAIQSFPRMMPNMLHRFMPLAKFHVHRHFIYITTQHKEEIKSYYKLTEKDME
jgi:hypothetical protein